ncbi:A24 family peptidase [Dethiobacter alkaliphilus]|uniref:Peptidase A24A prepilin type IV n=1 Tax=Dethiobacter alkaliphilus AHT 1 TaxID=555088 RepID=C0GEA6_DETAL|nr:A24 family peptidase [Dethiobacter alkaliphilus]EEG78400.1 peptidase A24A prepilin type IV [Dethiobacter alkaliphilus AHT 1]
MNYVLILFVALAAYFDVRQRRIPNKITFPIMIVGLVIYGFLEGLPGIAFGFTGLLSGLFVFFIPFALGGMGAGDVKMTAAVGALMGMQFVLHSAIFTIFAGGIMAIGYLIAHKRLLSGLKNVVGMIARPLLAMLAIRFRNPLINRFSVYFTPSPVEKKEEAIYLPYGVAIAAGAVLTLSGFGYQLLPVVETLF